MSQLEFRARMLPVVTGIVHVGANTGQEAGIYRSITNGPCLYVEPIDSVFEVLASRLRVGENEHPIKAVCSDQDDAEVEFKISSNAGESSSLLDLGRHADLYPGVTYVQTVRMRTSRLDTILQRFKPDPMPNLLVIDVQGAELLVLHGASGILDHVDAVFCEVSSTPLYEGGCTLDQIAAFLRDHDLLITWTEMLPGQGWGDAFFMRRNPPSRQPRPLSSLPTYGGNIAKGLPALISSRFEVDVDHRHGATNGKTTGHFGFHTAEEDRPWWVLDLGREQALREIRIFNRLGAAAERAFGLLVSLGDEAGDWSLVHDQGGRPFGGADGLPLRVELGGRLARYVRIQLAGRGWLHLDEVEVYAV